MSLQAYLVENGIINSASHSDLIDAARLFSETVCIEAVHSLGCSCDGKLHIFGSAGLGINMPGSDADFVFVAHSDKEIGLITFLDALERALAAYDEAHLITNSFLARVGFVRFQYRKQIQIDIAFAYLSTPLGVIDVTSVETYRWTSNQGFEALAGLRDLAAFKSAVPSMKTFQIVLGATRLWTKCAKVDNNKLSLLNGVAVATLSASICVAHRADPPELLLIKFLQELAKLTPKSVISLVAHNAYPSFSLPKPYTVEMHPSCPQFITPSLPGRNATYRITPSVAAAIAKQAHAALARAQSPTVDWVHFYTTRSPDFGNIWLKLFIAATPEPLDAGLDQRYMQHFLQSLPIFLKALDDEQGVTAVHPVLGDKISVWLSSEERKQLCKMQPAMQTIAKGRTEVKAHQVMLQLQFRGAALHISRPLKTLLQLLNEKKEEYRKCAVLYEIVKR